MRHKKKKDQFGDGFCQFGTRESWERNTGEREAGQRCRRWFREEVGGGVMEGERVSSVRFPQDPSVSTAPLGSAFEPRSP